MKPVFKLFYRENGIRFGLSLISPKLVKINELPRDSLFHYVPEDLDFYDIDPSLSIFQGYNKKIYYEHVREYIQPEGGFRKLTMDTKILARPFKRANLQKWYEFKDAYKFVSTPDALIVLNYGYLEKVYKYYPLPLAKYHHWVNRQRTIYNWMEQIAKYSSRQQFVYYPIPARLQGRTLLNKFAKAPADLRMVKLFGLDNYHGFLQLDLWRWMHPETRKYSLLNLISPKHYSKINLILTGKAGEVLINLGYLNSFIKGQDNTSDMSTVTQIDPEQLQKYSLKTELVLCSMLDVDAELDDAIADTPPVPTYTEPTSRSENKSIDEEVLDEVQEEDTTSTELEDTELPEEPTGENPQFWKKEDTRPKTGREELGKLFEFGKAKDLDVEETHDVEKELKDIEGDLDALDKLSLQRASTLTDQPSQPKTGKDKVLELADRSNTEEQVADEFAEQMENIEAQLRDIDLDIAELDKAFSKEEVTLELAQPKAPEETLLGTIEKRATNNLISASDYRKLKEAIEKHAKSPSPYNPKKSREEAKIITREDVEITPEKTDLVATEAVVDRSMGKATLNQFDRQYVRKVLKKDLLKTVDSLQNAGVVIKKHEVDYVSSVLGTHENHTLEFKPIDGMSSVVHFTLPKIEEDGTFMASGVKYRLRTQRTDLPIRKIAPQVVSLSTYYGKTFIQTSPKIVNSSLAWLIRQVNLSVFEEEAFIRDVVPNDVYDNEFKSPYIYGAMSKEFSSLTAGDIYLDFDKNARSKYAGENLERIERNGRVVCGTTNKGGYVLVNTKNIFYSVVNGQEKELGDIYEVLGLDTSKTPQDVAEMRVFSKYIPVGIILGYYLGFSKLLALLGEDGYRVINTGQRKNLENHEFAVAFSDKTYIFKNKNRTSALILAGFNVYEKQLRNYTRTEMETKDVYFNLITSKGLSAIYTKEMDLMENAFIDPISKEVLEEMGEPTTFKALIMRAVEMLSSYDYPVSQDRKAMRDRGYERLSGIVYKEMISSIREYRNKNILGKSRINISPYQIWNSLMSDNALKIVEDINPIQNLKEQEVITFSGIGGRDKDTMNKQSRAFHKSDIGVLSESTVDSSAVGTIAYLSADPNLSTVRGLMKEEKEVTPTSMLSTSVLISPAAMNDKSKRMMLISTQHSHTIASASYRQPYVKTGYEYIVGKRTGKLFSTAAEEDGKVVSLTDKGMVVQYKSGAQVGMELGRQYGRAEGTTYPHDLTTTLKEGQSFKRGDILSYNTKFFEPDFINPKNVIMKLNSSHTVAFMELNQTHEDSCAISSSLGEAFQTEVTDVRSFVVNFTQNVSEVVKVGTVVEPNTHLLIIEDEISSNYSQFSEDSLAALKRLSNVSPRASVSGVVEKVEVFYNGDTKDMTASLKRLTDKSNNDMATACKASGKPVVTGRVNTDYRVNGNPLEIDRAEIRIYVSVKNSTGVGDKVVFGHQMKSTVSEVLRGEIVTENGEKVDAIFSYGSAARRGVLSPAILGTTTTLLDAISKQAAKIYFGD